MILVHRIFLILCLAIYLPTSAFAYAPVVDDSENFALLEEQQAEIEQPVARDSRETYDDEQPLAKDTTSNNTASNIDLVNKIQGLQQDIQELRGQLEVQAHELKLLKEQQLSFYKDLDERLRAGSGKMAQNVPTTTPSPTSNIAVTPNVALQPPIDKPAVITSNNPADEQISYLAAYDLVKNKQFDEAMTAMKAFIAKYPQGGYTANAQYWLGELYMVKKDYVEAINHFDTVLKQFPTSSKCSASMLKIGYALAASNKKIEARQRLQEVLKKYPDTNTAHLASIKLESLGG